LGRGGASEDKNEDVLKQKRARMREVANLTDGRPVFNHNAPIRVVTAVLTSRKSHREKVARELPGVVVRQLTLILPRTRWQMSYIIAGVCSGGPGLGSGSPPLS
jgi:hypothetical protein